MKRAIAALWIGAALATAGPSAAASRVAIVRPPNPDATAREATTRLEAELRAAGFEVVFTETAPSEDPRADVEATERAPRALATIAIRGTPRDAVADVWVADHLSEKTSVRRIRVDDVNESRGTTLLAVRAVELLRASLLELDSPGEPSSLPADVARWVQKSHAKGAPSSPPAPAPPPRAIDRSASIAPTKEVDRPPVSPAEVAGVLAGVAVLGSVRAAGLGATVGPMLRASYPAPLGALARLSLFTGLTHHELTATHGRASLDQNLFELELVRPFGRRGAPLLPSISAGIGAHRLRAQGTGAAGYTGTERTAWSAAIDAGAGITWRLGPRFFLQGELHALFLLPEPTVQVAGKPAASAGAPLLAGSLGVGLVL